MSSAAAMISPAWPAIDAWWLMLSCGGRWLEAAASKAWPMARPEACSSTVIGQAGRRARAGSAASSPKAIASPMTGPHTAVDDQGGGDPGADDDEDEAREAPAMTEPALGAGRAAHIGADHDRNARHRRRGERLKRRHDERSVDPSLWGDVLGNSHPDPLHGQPAGRGPRWQHSRVARFEVKAVRRVVPGMPEPSARRHGELQHVKHLRRDVHTVDHEARGRVSPDVAGSVRRRYQRGTVEHGPGSGTPGRGVHGATACPIRAVDAIVGPRSTVSCRSRWRRLWSAARGWRPSQGR